MTTFKNLKKKKKKSLRSTTVFTIFRNILGILKKQSQFITHSAPQL